MQEPLILHAGDSALVVEFGREIAEDINARVHALDDAVRQKHIIGVTETVPTFCPFLTGASTLFFVYSGFSSTVLKSASFGISA